MGIRLSIDQVATYCGVRRKTVAHWVRTGKLAAMHMQGEAPTIRQQDFVAFLQQRGEPIPVDFIEDNKHRILIVDDDPEVVRTLAEMFTTFVGCSIKTALDGLEAGLRLATFKPHLVVLDLMMPRVDGYMVCSHIKADPATAGTPVLVITGDDTEQTIERALACGADYYLAKPVRLPQLQQAVCELLDDIRIWPAHRAAQEQTAIGRS